MAHEVSVHTDRLTPDEVIAAYRETGLVPSPGVWGNYTQLAPGDRACAMSAKMCALRKSAASPELAQVAAMTPMNSDLAAEVYGYAYVAGFIIGFDRGDSSLSFLGLGAAIDRRTATGAEDGASARAALVSAGLMTEASNDGRV